MWSSRYAAVLCKPLLERVALCIARRAQLILVGHRAGRRARAEEAPTETSALLVRPVDEPDSDRRLAVRRDSPQDLDGPYDVERSVEPAAVGNGVDVAADQERTLRTPAKREPLVSGRVGFLLDVERRDLLRQPILRPHPRLRPGDALGAVLISGQLT